MPPQTTPRLSSVLKETQDGNGYCLTSRSDLEKLRAAVGKGPARFAPKKPEQTVQSQLDMLTSEQRDTFDALIDMWDSKHPDQMFSDDLLLLRYLRCNKYKKSATWSAMKRTSSKYFELTASNMKAQLMTKTLFPIPGLKCARGHSVFYMKPSRYVPHQMPCKDVINNLAYVMNTMLEKESAQKHGIAFLANMNDWTMSHFTTEYCLKFMQMLQGITLPVKVTLFLIVNPPSWFNKIWTIMKSMLSEEFQQKVHMVNESELKYYLKYNYRNYLPDELKCGKANTEKLVQDFIVYRMSYEMNIKNTKKLRAKIYNEMEAKQLKDTQDALQRQQAGGRFRRILHPFSRPTTDRSLTTESSNGNSSESAGHDDDSSCPETDCVPTAGIDCSTPEHIHIPAQTFETEIDYNIFTTSTQILI